MLKKIYISAWILWAAVVFVSVLSGFTNPVTLLVFSFIALALVHTLMLWSVIVHARDTQPQ